ncbi:MAG: HEAT repeat domain-containing protein, partial [Verrucomicrobiota bacterium]
GVTGHDLHGLAFGPDGKLYFSIGDRGFSIVSREGRLLAYPDTGAVLRCNPDGTDLEVFCIGLRNPQELAFDAFGNLWTGDNDTAGPDNSRLLYLVEGGDYGWRCSYQHMPGFGPWVQENVWQGGVDGTLPHAGLPAQGPAGFAYYPGAGMGAEWKGQFLMCDFPGGIYSFLVQPAGASFEMTNRKKFLWNCWPTDVEFGPDGALYVSDWVEGWVMPQKGRIYRINQAREAGVIAAADFSKILAQAGSQSTLAQLREWLAHPHMRVRQKAQFELAERAQRELGTTPARLGGSVAILLETAQSGRTQFARIHALWGLGQVLEAAHKESIETTPRLVLKKIKPLLRDADPEIRAQTVRVFGHARSSDFTRELIRLLQDKNPRVQFFAALSLGRLGQTSAVPALLSMLRANSGNDPYLTHAAVMGLEGCGDLKTWQGLALDKSPVVRRAGLLVMRRKGLPEIAAFLNDADPGIAVEAARAINDVPIPAALPSLAEALNKRVPANGADREATFERWRTNASAQWVRRAINANVRVGTARNAEALALFAADASQPTAWRAEALEALGAWAQPGDLDRVMGLWRPLPARGSADARGALRSGISGLLRDGSMEVSAAAVRCAGRLQIEAAVPALHALFNAPSANASLRAEILKALAALDDPKLGEFVRQGLASSDLVLREHAIQFVEQAALADPAAELGRLLQSESNIQIAQTALEILGRMTNSPSVEKILQTQVERLLAGQSPPELALDILEAVTGRKSLGEDAKPFNLDVDGSNRNLRVEQALLRGGRAERGEKIFREHPAASCLRCHSIRGEGGTVGPPMDGIGKQKTREYLLESLLTPNKQIAAGYENVVVVLKNGGAIAGLVKRESETELEILSPEDGIIKVAKADVASRQPTLSAMPDDVTKTLTRKEVRDLIEFLAGLK